MTSFGEDFQYRVNYAAQCIRRGITSRRRDACYENNDGDLVVVALMRRARKNPEFMKAIVNHWRGAVHGHVHRRKQEISDDEIDARVHQRLNVRPDLGHLPLPQVDWI